MNKKKTTDSLVLGFAVFAMFFGAGNLIFPVGIGSAAGTQWPIAMLATTLVAVILPLLALIDATKFENGYEGLCAPVGKWYYVMTFAFCTIGISISSRSTHPPSSLPFWGCLRILSPTKEPIDIV